MRSLGALLVFAGIFGYVYAADQLALAGTVPEGLSLSQAWEYPAARWDTARYGAALAGVMGVILALWPKGR